MPTQLPRVSVIVTQEQHALLSELASLDPETRSIGAFLRQLVDEVTPLLRVQVPAMRAAAQETQSAKESLREPLQAFLAHVEQMDLLPPDSPSARNRSDGGARTARPAKRSRK